MSRAVTSTPFLCAPVALCGTIGSFKFATAVLNWYVECQFIYLIVADEAENFETTSSTPRRYDSRPLSIENWYTLAAYLMASTHGEGLLLYCGRVGVFFCQATCLDWGLEGCIVQTFNVYKFAPTKIYDTWILVHVSYNHLWFMGNNRAFLEAVQLYGVPSRVRKMFRFQTTW